MIQSEFNLTVAKDSVSDVESHVIQQSGPVRRI